MKSSDKSSFSNWSKIKSNVNSGVVIKLALPVSKMRSSGSFLSTCIITALPFVPNFPRDETAYAINKGCSEVSTKSLRKSYIWSLTNNPAVSNKIAFLSSETDSSFIKFMICPAELSICRLRPFRA